MRWNIIKRLVSQSTRNETVSLLSASRSRRKDLSLWQRRFWEHQIRDEDDFNRHMNYTHWNPMKHGYVSRVVDWPYSSFHRYLRDGVYPEDWAGYVEGDRAHSARYGFGEAE